jgi:hypothetical protein
MIDSLEQRLGKLGTRLDRDGTRIEQDALSEFASASRPPTSRARSKRAPRSRVLVAATVALAVIAAATGWLVTHDADSGRPKVSTPATKSVDDVPATTAAPGASRACVAFQGSSTKPRGGRSGQAAMTRDIDVQASGCGTSVYFLAGAGKWNVRYSSGTSTTLIARLGGAHAYVGTGVIPDTYKLDSPSVVTEMTRLRHPNDGDDPGTTWSIRLDHRYSFNAGQTTIGGSSVFAINVVAPSDTLQCRVAPNINITIPTDWYTGTVDTCHFLSPSPIVRTPFVGDNAAVHLVTGLQVSHIQDIGGAGGQVTQKDLGTLTINGRQATRTLSTNTTPGSGVYTEYQVVIQWDPETALVISGVTRPFPPQAPSRAPINLADLKTAIDAIADSATPVP